MNKVICQISTLLPDLNHILSKPNISIRKFLSSKFIDYMRLLQIFDSFVLLIKEGSMEFLFFPQFIKESQTIPNWIFNNKHHSWHSFILVSISQFWKWIILLITFWKSYSTYFFLPNQCLILTFMTGLHDQVVYQHCTCISCFSS